MRVLFLCHRVPYPPNKGEKIRAFHQLKAMGARHDVDLFTLADDPEDLKHRSALLEYCRDVTIAPLQPMLGRLKTLPYLLTRQPLTIPYFHSAELQAAVDAAIAQRKYDRIFVYCSAMAQYVQNVRDIPVVVDLVDVDSDKWTQYASFARFPWSAVYRREGKRLREYEKKVCEEVSCVVVTTDREAQLVRQMSSTARVRVIPNGVDTNYFKPSEVPAAARHTVTFTGDMSYFPNQDAVVFFANKVLPLIRKSVPDVRFLIVGRNPNRDVLRLREIDGVEVTGFVPDVRTYLAQTHVAVAPFSIAAGIQNKILEAMSYGLPVVATTRTASGLSVSVGELVETGNTAEELAAKVVGLLANSELARKTGQESRRRVTAEYNWEHNLNQLLEIVEHPPGSGSAERESVPEAMLHPSK